MPNQCKYRTPEERLTIVKEHLIGRKPGSESCEIYGVTPSQFYTWQADLFEHGAQCFDRPKKNKAVETREAKRVKELEDKLSKTESKLAQKNGVVTELMEEHLKLRKSIREI